MPGLASQFTRLDCITSLLERCGAYGESQRARNEVRKAQTNNQVIGIIERWEERAAELSARHINPPDPLPLESLTDYEVRERRSLD